MAQEIAIAIKVDDQGSLRIFDSAGKAVAEFGRATDEAAKKASESGKAVKQSGEDAEKSGRSFRESASGVKEWVSAAVGLNQALDLIGRVKAIIGGGIEFFKSGVDDLAKLHEVNRVTGASVDMLSRWSIALKAADVSSQEFALAMRGMSSAIVEGTSNAESSSRKLIEVLVGDFGRFKAMAPEEQFKQLGAAVMSIEDPAQRTKTAMELFGRGFQSVLRLFADGQEEVDDFIGYFDRLGVKIDENVVTKADTVSDSFAKMMGGFDLIKTGFFAGMIDGLAEFASSASEKVVPVLQRLIAGSQDFGAQVGEALAGIIPKVEAFAERVSQVGMWEAVKEQFQELQTWLQGQYIELGDKYGPVLTDAGKRIGSAILDGMKEALLGGLAAIGESITSFFSNFFKADAVLPDLYAKRDELLGSARTAGGVGNTDQQARYQAEAKAIQDKIATIERLTAAEKAAEPPARVLVEAAKDGADAQTKGAAATEHHSSSILKGAAATALFDSVVVKAGPNAKSLGDALGSGKGGAADAVASFSQKLDASKTAIGILDAAAKSGGNMGQALRDAALAATDIPKGLTAAQAQALAFSQAQQKVAEETAAGIDALRDQVEQAEAYGSALEGAIDAGLSYADATKVAAEAQAKVADQQKVSAIEGTTLAEVYKKTAAEARALAAAEAARQAVLQAKDTTANMRLELQLTQAVNQGLITELDKKIAIARAGAGISAELADEAEAQVKIQAAIEDQATAYVHLGDIIKDSFSQAFDAVISGTRDLGDTLEGIGLGIGKRLFTSMLDSKLKDFDPTVKANFLDLGNYGEGIFSKLFKGAGSFFGGGGDGAGSYGVLLSDVAGGSTDHGGGWLSSLLGGGGGGGGGIGVLANLALNSGGFFAKSNPGISLGLSGLSALNSGLSIATGSGIIGSLFGSSASSATLGSLLGASSAGSQGGIVGSLLGTSLGTVGAVGGGIVGGAGGIYSGYQLGAGGLSTGQKAASAASVVAGGLAVYASLLTLTATAASALNSIPIIGTIIYAVLVAIAALVGVFTKHTPMAAGILRKQSEGVLDSIETFQELQKRLGDISESNGNYKKGSKESLNTFGSGGVRRNQLTGEDTARDRGFSEEAITNVTGFAGLFAANYFKDSTLTRDGNPVLMMAAQQSQVLSEFFSRAKMETGQYAEFTAGELHKAFTEMGVDAVKAMGLVNTLSQTYNKVLATQDDPKLADDRKQLFGVNVAESIRGAGAIFEAGEDAVPQGVHIAALAVQTLEKDGQKAFGALNGVASDFFVKLADNAEAFDAVVNQLLQQGFEINTEDFKLRLQDISASASFIGENIGAVFTGPSVSSGIDAMMEKLRSSVGEGMLGEAQKQLFDTTNIAASFEPVFAVMRELKDGKFDLTDAGGSQMFSAEMVQAIAEGRANLEEYIPQLRAIRDAAKEVDEAIAEALKPTAEETAWIRLAENLDTARENAKQLAAELFNVAVAAEIQQPGSGGKAVQRSVRASINTGLLGDATTAAQEAAAKSPQADALAGAQLQWKAGLEKAMKDGTISGAEQADLKALRDKVRAAGDEFAKSAAAGAEVIGKLFDDQHEAEKQAILGATSGAAGSMFSKLQEKDASAEDAVKAFGESFRQSIASNVFQGMQEALVQSAVLEGSLAPLMAGFKQAVSGALADGTISGAEQAGLDQFVKAIGQQTDATISALGPTLNQFATLGQGLLGKAEDAKGSLKVVGGDIERVNDQTEKLSDGAAKAGEQLNTIADGLKTADLATGTDALKEALGTETTGALKDGTDALKEALGTDKAGEIKDAVSKMADALGGASGSGGAGGAADIKAGIDAMAGALGSAADGPAAQIGAGVGAMADALRPDLVTALKDGVVSASEALDLEKTGTIGAAVDAMRGALAPEAASGGIVAGIGALQGALAPDAMSSIADPVVQAFDGVQTQAGNAADQLERLAGILAALSAPRTTDTTGTGDGTDFAALGGTFTDSAVVGEGGSPELVTALPGGGFSVSPLSWNAAKQLMRGGTQGLATGGNVRGIGTGGRGWGGSPYVGADDARNPANQTDRSGAGGDEQKQSETVSGIASAFKAALADGKDFATEFAKSLGDATRERLVDAIIAGFSKQKDIVKESAAIDGLIAKAEGLAAKGKLDEKTAADIAGQIAGHAKVISDKAKAMEPILAQFKKAEEIAKAVGSIDFGAALGGLATLNLKDSAAVKAWEDTLQQSTDKAVLDGVVNALLASGPLADSIKSFTEDLNKQMTEKLADGSLSEQEAAELGEGARAGAAALSEKMKALAPVFKALGLNIGDGAGAAAKRVQETFGSAIAQTFADPTKAATFEQFTKNLKAALYAKIRDGLVQAFIDSAIIQGALAPMLNAIERIFRKIGQDQMDIATGNAKIAKQIALMLDVLKDPEFKAAFEEIAKSIAGVATELGQTTVEVDKAADSFDNAADASADACAGQCNLAKRLSIVDLGISQLSTLGREGSLQAGLYVPYLPEPRKFATGGDVYRPTWALLGEAGPERVSPIGGRGASASAEDAREQRDLLERIARTLEDRDDGPSGDMVVRDWNGRELLRATAEAAPRQAKGRRRVWPAETVR